MNEQREKLTEHWNKSYQTKEDHTLGWFEEEATPSLQLIKASQIDKDARILHVGAGTSTLIDDLLHEGYTHQIVNDLSEVALNKLANRLGDSANQVDWIVDDLTQPTTLSKIEPVDLWHDRAVLHFFTDEQDQDQYFQLLDQVVTPGGYVIIATFHVSGAPKCNGLELQRYDEEMIQNKLGDNYELLQSFPHEYIQPSGNKRPYIYTLFKKKK